MDCNTCLNNMNNLRRLAQEQGSCGSGSKECGGTCGDGNSSNAIILPQEQNYIRREGEPLQPQFRQQQPQQQQAPKVNPNLDVENYEFPEIIGGFLNVTQRCNLKCKYCFVVQQPKDMEYQVAKDTADFFAKNAAKINDTPGINFFGGEPLLRWDDIIVPLSKYIRKEYGDKFDLGITTNGILLDKKKLEFMKEHKIGFLFSIDGDKKTQDLNRPFHNGNGSFDILKKKIPMILEYQPNSTFRSTIDNDNVSEIFHNFKFAIDSGFKNVFGIVNVFNEWTDEEKEILKEQIGLIADFYMDNLREGKVTSFNPLTEMFGKIKKVNLAEKNGEFRDRGKSHIGFGRCGIGANKFGSVGMNGDIYSCQELVENPELGDKFTIGNIYTGMDHNQRVKIVKQFDPRNVIRSDNIPCNGCRLNKICDGSCLINNYFANGDMNIMSAVLCFFYQVLFDEALRVMETMAKEENEKFRQIFNEA